MTAKQYLKQLKQLENAIRVMEGELYRIRTKAESPGGPKYTAARVQYSSGDAMENGVVKLVDLENRIRDKIVEYEETRQRIVEEILSMPDATQAKVLYAIYVDGLPSWKVARRIGYSERHTKRIHRNALTGFSNRYLGN